MSILDTFINRNETIDIDMFDPPGDVDKPKSEYTATKAQRIHSCGQNFAKGLNPHTGRYGTIAYRCGFVRDCPKCREKAAGDLRSSLHKLVDLPDVRIGIVAEAEAAEICAELGRDEYRKFPLSGGDVLVIYRGDGEQELFNEETWENLPYEEIVVAPKGKRKSGGLGVVTTTKEATVKVKVIVAPSARSVDWNTAAKNAVLATSHLNPRNIKELEEALEVRHLAMCIELDKLGVRYFLSTYQQPFDIGRLHWLGADNHNWVEEEFTFTSKSFEDRSFEDRLWKAA